MKSIAYFAPPFGDFAAGGLQSAFTSGHPALRLLTGKLLPPRLPVNVPMDYSTFVLRRPPN